jgi:hypothetical protein
MFCLCGKDPWMKIRTPKRPAISKIGVAMEATGDGTAQRYAGMFARLYTFAFEVVSLRHTLIHSYMHPGTPIAYRSQNWPRALMLFREWGAGGIERDRSVVGWRPEVAILDP